MRVLDRTRAQLISWLSSNLATAHDWCQLSPGKNKNGTVESETSSDEQYIEYFSQAAIASRNEIDISRLPKAKGFEEQGKLSKLSSQWSLGRHELSRLRSVAVLEQFLKLDPRDGWLSLLRSKFTDYENRFLEDEFEELEYIVMRFKYLLSPLAKCILCTA